MKVNVYKFDVKKMRELLFCSNNIHKTEEIRKMLPSGYRISSLKEEGIFTDIPETGETFEENALIKVRAVKSDNHSGCFADDSGLCVEYLDDAPGVHSARYAGEHATDADNRSKLLNELKGINNRNAYFITVICLLMDASVQYFEGRIYGRITTEERGIGGFGYDRIFIPDNYDKTFAEMTSDEKNKISHRYLALQKMMQFLKGKQ